MQETKILRIVIGRDGKRTVRDYFSRNWLGFKQSLGLSGPARFPPIGEEVGKGEKEYKEGNEDVEEGQEGRDESEL